MMTGAVPERTHSIINTFRVADLPLETQFNVDVPDGELYLIIGFKP